MKITRSKCIADLAFEFEKQQDAGKTVKLTVRQKEQLQLIYRDFNVLANGYKVKPSIKFTLKDEKLLFWLFLFWGWLDITLHIHIMVNVCWANFRDKMCAKL